MATLKTDLSISSFQLNDKIRLALIIVLGLVAWINPDTFIWRDEWTYLSYYYSGNFKLLNGNLAFEIKPLFQYVMFAEFYLGSTHFALYQAFNALLLVLIGICVFRVLQLFSIDSDSALICSLFFLLHPVNFVNAFWIFQQCELIHLACLFGCIVYFKKYLNDSSPVAFVTYGTLLFLQNFFFPNGVFLPLLFVSHSLLLQKRKKLDVKFLFLNIGIMVLHLVHAFYIQGRMESQTGVFGHLPDKLNYLIKLLSTSIWRVVIPNFTPQSSLLINFATVLAGCLFLAVTMRRLQESSKKLIEFSLLGLLVTSIVLVLTRYNQEEIHYYYTAIHLPFLFLIIGVYVNHFNNPPKKIFVAVVTIGIFLFLAVDYKGKQIFASRNIANQRQMEKAVLTRRYEPYDDPFFLPQDYIFFRVGDLPQSEGAVILYESLSK